jgi:hypothetical protein
MGAAIALGGAEGPCTPLTGDTVDWAVVEVAVLLVAEVRASITAESSRFGDGADTHLVTAIADGGAGTPIAKVRDCAVAGGFVGVAVAKVARLVLVQVGAADAARSRAHDMAEALLRADATYLGADAPLAPVRVLAVSGTGVGVAAHSVHEVRAGDTTVGTVDHDSTGLSLDAAVAGLVAVGPSTPARDFTVDCTRVDVAVVGAE